MSEPFLDVVRRSWLPFLALLLLLLLLIRLEAQSADIDHGQKDVTEAKRSDDQMSDFVTGFSAWVEMQNKLSGKITTIENILSCKMPPEWEALLNKLEAQVKGSEPRPKGEKEIKQFDKQVSELVTGLPAWADAHCFPRLSLVRWASLAFNHLNDSQNPDQLRNNLAMAEAMRDWADAMPDGNAADLGQELRNKADEVENKQIKLAIQWAEEYLDGKANAQTDIESIDAFLALHENDSVQDDSKKTEVARIRKELESKLHREFEEQQDKARRVYQECALGEIEAFMGKLQNVIDGVGQVPEGANQTSEEANQDEQPSSENVVYLIVDSTGKVIADSTEKIIAKAKQLLPMPESWEAKHYEEIQKAMIDHLLPIDLALLELPVLKLYRRVFDDGWNRLRHKEQMAVAKESANPVKRSLRTCLENQS